MLGKAVGGLLEGCITLRLQVCRIVSTTGIASEYHNCAKQLASPLLSGAGGASLSIRRISIESSKLDDSTPESGVSESSPDAEQSIASAEDALAGSAAAEVSELPERPGPNPNADMDNMPLPDPSQAEKMIADLIAQDPEPPVVINRAGVHNPGWKLKDIDEENYRLWWVYDLTGGRIPLADRNAKLSDRAKYYMYRLNKFGGWTVKNLARLFNVREERVMAIVALQQLDAEARERGDPLLDDLQALADQVVGATEMRGTGERHIRLLPTRPAFEVLDKQQAGKREVAGRYKYRMTEADNPNDPGWESEVRAREEEVGRYEGKILAREFKERLAYNIGQTGKTISRASLRTGPPKRPAEGWSLVVRPAGRGQDYEPFVAKPDGTRRAPSEDESLYLKRMKPLPRRRIM